MANAYKDENGISTLIATLNTDGSGIVRVLANPTNHGLEVSDGTTGSDNGNNKGNANRDNNNVPVLIAVSSATTTVNGVNYVQGITPVEVYSDSSGNLLVNSM